jgi:KDO2-lipid IV(A) lauroyltransferase
MPPRVRPLHLLQYVVVRAVLAAVRCLSPDAARRAACGAADLFFRLDRRHRERAIRHLSEALPDLSAEERYETARSSFRSFAMTIVETLFFERIVQEGAIRDLLEFELHPDARAALDEGRGAVFATAHIGNWEMTGVGVAFYGIPLVSVARPIDNPLLDRLIVSQREKRGQRIITKRGAVREMSRALRDGGYLGILVDQNGGRRGVFVPYFGRLASTTAAPATLALRFRAPLITAWQRRVDGGRRHVIEVESPIPFPETGDRDEDVRIMTAEMTARVESWVRREPGQWLWSHRRWRTRPPEEKK